MKFVLFVQLHIKFRITRIHTGFNTVFHRLVITACLCIFVRVFAYATECQKGTEPKCCCRMGIDQGVTNQYPVLMMYKNFLFAENNASHTVSSCRDMLAIKLTDILMSVRTKIISLILVQSQVKLCTVLNHCFIQRRQQHMVFIIQVGNGNYQQAVIFACVTIYNRCTMIGS